jgi:hypothetical protein
MKRHLLTLAAAFALALLLGLALALPVLLNALPQPASLAPADSPLTPDVAFEGMIHAVGTGTPALWVIDDFPVTVISTTVIISNGLVARPGVWARVEAAKRGGLHATVVELQAVPTSDLYDRIEALAEAQGVWQVGNTWVHVGPETQLTGPPPAIGSLALVHGVRSGNGIDARRILVVAADSEVIYQGTLVGLGPDTWQVGDVTLEITSTTVFSGAVPTLGSQVQARGVETGPRRLLATHIWTLDGVEPQVSFTGWLQRIEGQAFPYLWRVNFLDGPALRPVFVLVYDDTLVDETAGPANPGAWLTIASLYQGSAVYRAQSIAVLPRAPKRQIVGQIASLPASGLVGIWQVDAYRVEVGQGTGIVGTPGVGAMVWVSGAPDYANILQAQLIEVLGE